MDLKISRSPAISSAGMVAAMTFMACRLSLLLAAKVLQRAASGEGKEVKGCVGDQGGCTHAHASS